MNVLAIGCHPDDLEIGCGGTLAKLASLHHRVTMVHVANGDKGHKVIPSKELIRIRGQEAIAAGALIGAEVIGLGLPDLSVKADNDDLVRALADVIRGTKPDYIITHPPEDYMKDHMEVSKAVFDASFAATVPYYDTGSGHSACEQVAPLFYMDTLAGIGYFQPTQYVDITGQMETKLNMNRCHESQIKWLLEHDGIDFMDFVRTISKFRGLQCGVGFAEGFTTCQAWPRLRPGRLLP